jgi:hypothetical protein
LGTVAGYLVVVVAVFFVRLGVFLLVVAAVAIGIVPILVLIDLLDGGTGFGLCPAGIEACHQPYTAGAEMIIVLSVALFLVLAGIRILMRVSRRLRNDSYQVSQ